MQRTIILGADQPRISFMVLWAPFYLLRSLSPFYPHSNQFQVTPIHTTRKIHSFPNFFISLLLRLPRPFISRIEYFCCCFCCRYWVCCIWHKVWIHVSTARDIISVDRANNIWKRIHDIRSLTSRGKYELKHQIIPKNTKENRKTPKTTEVHWKKYDSAVSSLWYQTTTHLKTLPYEAYNLMYFLVLSAMVQSVSSGL